MVNRALTVILLALLRAYKTLVSPLFRGVCRFSPSCSTYASEAVTRHGPWRGGLLAVWRLARCHPLAKGGYDPVPRRSEAGRMAGRPTRG